MKYGFYSSISRTLPRLLIFENDLNPEHANIIRDFVMKIIFCKSIVSEALDELVLSGPILKIFGKQIKDNQMTIDDNEKFIQFNFLDRSFTPLNEFSFFTHE